MSRTFHELSSAEQNAYRVYQSKLADRTLPASEHDRIRREIDNLLWKGPNAQVQKLAQQVDRLLDRIERLEFHAGLADPVFAKPSFPIGADQVRAMVKDCGANPAKAIRPFGEGLQPNIMPTTVDAQSASIPEPTDPFDLPEYRTAPAGLAPCGQFAVDPHPSDADHGKPVLSWPDRVANGETVVLNSPAPVATDPTPDEKKPGRGRPKGAKNKPKSPPVASGEGKEQAATTVEGGVVTEINPSFTDQMVSGEGEDAAPMDDFWPNQ